MLEIREKFGVGSYRVHPGGRPPDGGYRNNPHHLAGAIDSDGADKGARLSSYAMPLTYRYFR
ncbi:MAG: hypothetical protein Ct9H300mP8_09210 [Gammaproteobacteria bacterium]|nr:MAG: hypothetical protein Ct9H300mP8_09210 [Gammaproteobacteria bacterium]